MPAKTLDSFITSAARGKVATRQPTLRHRGTVLSGQWHGIAGPGGGRSQKKRTRLGILASQLVRRRTNSAEEIEPRVSRPSFIGFDFFFFFFLKAKQHGRIGFSIFTEFGFVADEIKARWIFKGLSMKIKGKLLYVTEGGERKGRKVVWLAH